MGEGVDVRGRDMCMAWVRVVVQRFEIMGGGVACGRLRRSAGLAGLVL